MGVLVLVVLGAILIISKNPTNIEAQKKSETNKVASTPTPTTSTTPTEKSYLMTEVSLHNNKTSCWTTVGQNVYDVTTWINKHPGGEQAILQLCGKDGTELFTKQHGGQKQAEAVLQSFLIGKLQ